MSKNSSKQSLEAVKEWLAWMKNNKGKKNITPYGRQIYTYGGIIVVGTGLILGKVTHIYDKLTIINL